MDRRLIIAGYLGKWGESDGVVTTYSNLIPHLATADCLFDILCYGPDDAIEKVGNVTIYIHKPRLRTKIDPSRWIDLGLPLSPLYRQVLRTRYSLVQTSAPETLGMLALHVARRNKCPFVGVYHTALGDYVKIRFSRKFGRPVGYVCGHLMAGILHWYYGKADLILAPSHCVAEELRKTYSAPVRVLSRGIDLDRFTPVHRTRTDSHVQALYVGRVAPEKNLQLLTKLFKQLDDVELVVVGDGPYLKEMKRELPRAIYRGRLNGSELTKAYANGDFFVFPSYTDTLGNVVLEALSSGLPTVVTNSLGPQELIEHGKTGFIAANETEFEESVRRLLADGALRRRMSAAARQSVAQRRWADIAEQLLVYHELALGSREVRRPLASATPGHTFATWGL
jgi:glycosyltransferase involved in cell wall biosynthesis